MTWKDKLELGLKEDAAYRKDNLPPNQVRGPEIDTGPGRSPEIPRARADETEVEPANEDAPEKSDQAENPDQPITDAPASGRRS